MTTLEAHAPHFFLYEAHQAVVHYFVHSAHHLYNQFTIIELQTNWVTELVDVLQL